MHYVGGGSNLLSGIFRLLIFMQRVKFFHLHKATCEDNLGSDYNILSFLA